MKPRLTLALGYSGLRASKLGASINRNVRPAVAKLPNGKNDYQVVGSNAASRVFDPAIALALINEPAGESLYHGASMSVRRPFSRVFGFMLNYVFSKNIDNNGGVVSTSSPEDMYHLELDRSLSKRPCQTSSGADFEWGG
jgi:hypothetical protein